MPKTKKLTPKQQEKKTMQRIQLHSWHILFLLAVTVTFGVIGIGFIVQNNPLFNAFDAYFYKLLSNINNPFIDTIIRPFNFNFIPANPFTFLPSYLYVMVGLFLIYIAIFKRSLFWWAVFTLVLATILAQIITALHWEFVFRQRPFLSLPNDLTEVEKQIWKGYSSFPSGHSRETMIYAVIIGNYLPKIRIIMIAFAVFVALSRVYLGAHFPTDVIAGLFVGYLVAKMSLIISRELQVIVDRRKGKEDGDVPKQAESDVQKD